MARHLWFASGAVICVAAFTWLYRFELSIRLQAGGRPLLRVRLRLRILGIALRREWRVDRLDAGDVARRVLRTGGAGRQPPSEATQPGKPRPGTPRIETSHPRTPHTGRWLKFARHIVAALSLRQLTVRMSLSTGDAAQTAVACGVLNALGGVAAAGIKRLPHAPRRVAIEAHPLWGPDRVWLLDLRCIARPRLSQAISAAWRLYLAFRAAGALWAGPAARIPATAGTGSERPGGHRRPGQKGVA